MTTENFEDNKLKKAFKNGGLKASKEFRMKSKHEQIAIKISESIPCPRGDVNGD